jgi:hypothetical protein
VASNYPGSLDSFDTIASDKKTSDSVGGRTHRQMHNDLGDAIESVQTELGTNPSGSDATVAARLSAIEAGTNLATGAVTSAKIADGTIVNGDINASAAIARSKISGLPTSSTDNTVARFDSTAGAIQTSGVVIDDNNRLTVATGATGGYGFASGATHLSGTGSPEGVVTAAPGSTWLQTDATTDVKGWIRWVKATGTGNTGWKVGPEADTGTRNLNGVTWSNGWASWGANGQRIRRVGNLVDVELDLTKAAASADTCYTLPTGFRPFSPSVAAYFTAKTANSAVPAEVAVVNGVVAVSRSSLGGDVMYLRMIFITSDAWPTSLPGA